ncbi:A24 family peptidase [Niveibacterium sp.]|uniref:prepilin peptidase n=1 Tax=Niveibacterium sp. TaxID=2017444 RepID=UPI0035B157BA
MSEISASPELLVALSCVLGLCVGSFLNVVIHRLPQIMEAEWLAQAADLRGEPIAEIPPLSISKPRSRCPHCGTPIASWQNIPLLSYLVLRGRCAHCRAPIGIRYPIVEILGGLTAALAAWHFGYSLAALGAMAFGWAMIALTFIDLDTQLLPDSITLPLLWLGLLLNLGGHYVPLEAAVIGAAAGYIALWSVYWLFKLVTGKEGMGYGDFKLLAAVGAFVGWQQLPLVILASSAIGAIVGIALIVFARHGRSQPIPFGPYLAGAGIVALYWGPNITRSYLAQI